MDRKEIPHSVSDVQRPCVFAPGIPDIDRPQHYGRHKCYSDMECYGFLRDFISIPDSGSRELDHIPMMQPAKMRNKGSAPSRAHIGSLGLFLCSISRLEVVRARLICQYLGETSV